MPLAMMALHSTMVRLGTSVDSFHIQPTSCMNTKAPLVKMQTVLMSAVSAKGATHAHC